MKKTFINTYHPIIPHVKIEKANNGYEATLSNYTKP